MTVDDFVNELKHKTINIVIVRNEEVVFNNNVGSYIHWIYRSRYGYTEVIDIKPFYKGFRLILGY